MLFDVEFKAAANVFFIWHTFCWAHCPPLLCKVCWRRMVMTLALWDYKWVKFKRSLYIWAPVNQTRPVPGLQAEKAKECLAYVCVTSVRALVCVCMCVCGGDGGGGGWGGRVEEWKDQSTQAWCSAERSPLHSFPFCQFFTSDIWAQETRLLPSTRTHLKQSCCLTLKQNYWIIIYAKMFLEKQCVSADCDMSHFFSCCSLTHLLNVYAQVHRCVAGPYLLHYSKAPYRGQLKC